MAKLIVLMQGGGAIGAAWIDGRLWLQIDTINTTSEFGHARFVVLDPAQIVGTPPYIAGIESTPREPSLARPLGFLAYDGQDGAGQGEADDPDGADEQAPELEPDFAAIVREAIPRALAELDRNDAIRRMDLADAQAFMASYRIAESMAESEGTA